MDNSRYINILYFLLYIIIPKLQLGYKRRALYLQRLLVADDRRDKLETNYFK